MADIKHKLIFNITFHQQFDNLKFHVDRILNWTISDDIKFMFTSAHESNLDKIEKRSPPKPGFGGYREGKELNTQG